MLINRLIAPLSAATVTVLPLGQASLADLLIKVDKSAQHMTVTVNGEQLHARQHWLLKNEGLLPSRSSAFGTGPQSHRAFIRDVSGAWQYQAGFGLKMGS